MKIRISVRSLKITLAFEKTCGILLSVVNSSCLHHVSIKMAIVMKMQGFVDVV